MNPHRTLQARSQCFAAVVFLGAALSLEAVEARAAEGPRLSAGYGNLPLSFEANLGQSETPVRFLARGQGYGLFLTPTEAVLSLSPQTRNRNGSAAPAAVVRMGFVGANENPQISGLDRLPGTSNYFIGDDPARWQRDVPNFARVRVAGVYPGVDLIYHGNQRQLEYDLMVAPGADPRRIAFAFEGVRKLSIDPEGNLVLRTRDGDIVQHKPVIYQEVGGKREPVGGGYVLRANRRVGFKVARYDTSRPLVIDPVLSYSTYLGGTGNDIGRAIAVDGAGSAYVAGGTTSTNFPGAGGSPIQPNLLGSGDVFVTKLNAAGSALVYSTYLGGSGLDTAYAIAVDSTGAAYVTGETDSPTVAGPGNIPYPRVGAIQGVYAGGGDAFVTKINPAGNALVYSTYLGGSGTERGYGIAVDASFNAYVTGHTSSVNGPGNFPTAFPFQSQNGSLGNFDAFVTKINATGSALVYSTYLGGNASEYSLDGGAIAVDADGNAYVGGTTASANFPGASSSTIQGTYGGGTNDGFVVKFNSAGSALLYSTFLGGGGYDAVNGIAIDAGRNAYAAGYTTSIDFPTASPLQPSKGDVGSGEDAFVSKLNPAGSALVYSTYLGGSGGERAFDIAVDGGGNATVCGFTSSGDFPTVAPFQPVRGGTGDAFVSRVNAGGSALTYSTYLGGSSGSEQAHAIALDGAGNAYVTGETSSTNFPTARPYQSTFGGAGTDAFVAKVLAVVPPGDFDGDGKSDIVWRNTTNGTNAVWYMNGLAVTGGGAFNVAPTSWSIVGVGDFNGDGHPDIVWRNTNGSNAVWYMNGLTVIGGGSFNAASTDWSIVGVADFNGDGHPDIVWRNFNGSNAVWFMNGLTVTGGGAFDAASTDWSIVGVADFNGDGHPDIVWRNVNGSNAVWYMDGLTLSGGAGFTSAPTAWSIVGVGDFNGDGKPDIAWRNTTNGSNAIWYMDGLNVIGGGAFNSAPTSWSIVGPK